MPKAKEHTPLMAGLSSKGPSTIPLKRGGAFQWGKPVDNTEEGWDAEPKGWTDQSRDKYYKSMSKEGPTSACMDKIDGHVDDPGAFCGSLRDKVTGDTHWRHGGKKK